MSYTHFSKTERMELSILRKKGHSLRDIARELGRNPSSVSRELKRNQVKEGWYHATKANHKAYVARKQSKYQGMKIGEQPWLEEYIRDKLERRWTPEEIAGRLELEYGYSVISFKAIYKWLYSQYGQRYCSYLPSRRYRVGKRKGGRKQKKQIIPNRVLIEERPRIISVRGRCGDFEADTLGVPRTSKGTIAGMVDRKSRYFLAKKIAKLRYAMDRFKELSDPFSVYSVTFDNGVENARHEELGVATYFCHSYSSWQKGSIENSFQRLRRFIPKKARIDDYPARQISFICGMMNNTPRKCLAYQTPKEVFEQEQGRILISKTNKSNLDVLHLRG